MSGAFAYISNDDKSTLKLNPHIFSNIKSYEDFKNIIGGRIRAYHNNMSILSMLIHEIAHSVSLEVDEEKIVKSTCDWFIGKKPKVGMDAYLQDFQYVGEFVSRYASTDLHEFFAECFADFYANGKNANEISKMLVEQFKKEIM